jgi:hypothetical protein
MPCNGSRMRMGKYVQCIYTNLLFLRWNETGSPGIQVVIDPLFELWMTAMKEIERLVK